MHSTPRPSDETTQGTASREGHERVEQLRRGDTLGRYVVLELLGVGGMGEVFAAYDPELDRKIAVKLLRSGGDGKSSAAAERLIREAKAMARVSHRNVITVHDVGTHQGRVFVAMEYLDGGTLADWMKQGPHSWRAVVMYFRAAGLGLAAAHAQGLVHRDFKPANVLLGSDGRVRVADFGLARRASDAREARRLTPVSDSHDSLDDPLTPGGTMLGTPAYMAPEQYYGDPIDARADQFSFCVALYEALYGERPFPGDNLHARMLAIAEGRIRDPPPGSAVPLRLRRLVIRGLAHDPNKRWPDMDSLLVKRRDPVLLRRRLLLAAATGCGLTLAGVGFGLHMSSPSEPAVCIGAAQALGDAYDGQDRAAIERTFTEFGAESTANELLARLDEWGQGWQEAWLDACRATRVRGDQSEDLLDRRMACLDLQRSRFAAFVDTMASADQAMAARALELIGELDDLAACSDRAALMRQVPLPSEPERVAAIQAAEGGLEQVRLLQLAGRPRVAAGLLEEQRALVERADWAPLTAVFLAAEGWQLLREDRPVEAEQVLKRGFATALSVGDDSLARAIARRIAGVGKETPELARDSLDWLELATALAIREGSNDAVLAQLVLVRSQTLVTLGDYSGALAAAEEGFERLARAEPDGTSIGSALYQIATTEALLGRRTQALNHLEQAEQAWARGLEPDHLNFLAARTLRGQLAREAGELLDARAQFEHVLRIKRENLGPDSGETIATELELARTLAELGELELALALAVRVVEQRRTKLAPQHSLIGAALIELAAIELAAIELHGQLDSAYAHAIEAEGILRAVLDPAHPELDAAVRTREAIEAARGLDP